MLVVVIFLNIKYTYIVPKLVKSIQGVYIDPTFKLHWPEVKKDIMVHNTGIMSTDIQGIP